MTLRSARIGMQHIDILIQHQDEFRATVHGLSVIGSNWIIQHMTLTERVVIDAEFIDELMTQMEHDGMSVLKR